MRHIRDNKILSVSELTHSLKTLLELQYRFVHIEGEVSNLRTPYSGHSYFTLKDSKSQIRAVIFKQQQKYLQRQIKEGQSIVCHGRISVYELRGEYQIIVDTVDFSGKGNLYLEFERLKSKLADEGLFDERNKNKIRRFPEKIVIVTSPTGAAIQDFIKIASNRNYWGLITILPVAVQGPKASVEIAAAIETANRETDADLLVLIRGGGSLEDLWSFNEEITARAIHRSKLPVVTGVGHETDFTIADMCSDLHTHTPTAAAEKIIPDCGYLLGEIQSAKSRLTDNVNDTISSYQREVNSCLRVMGDLDLYLSNFSLRVDNRLSSLAGTMNYKINSISTKVETMAARFLNLAPSTRLTHKEDKLKYLKRELQTSMKYLLERKEDLFLKQVALMDSVSPLSVLARGYSVVTDVNGEVVQDADQVEKGDTVDVRLKKGRLVCDIMEKKAAEKEEK